jgi:hypothetical protein
VSAPSGSDQPPPEEPLSEKPLFYRRTHGNDGPTAPFAVTRILTFERLKWASFTHSCVYLALLVCAFTAGNPEPLTFVLGLAHGLIWIGMSLACILAARLRIVPLRLAVAVAVLGGIGPFFGSYEFIREQRHRPR